MSLRRMMKLKDFKKLIKSDATEVKAPALPAGSIWYSTFAAGRELKLTSHQNICNKLKSMYNAGKLTRHVIGQRVYYAPVGYKTIKEAADNLFSDCVAPKGYLTVSDAGRKFKINYKVIYARLSLKPKPFITRFIKSGSCVKNTRLYSIADLKSIIFNKKS